MGAALTVEGRKLRRSRVVVVASAVQVLAVPLLAFVLVRAAAADGVGLLAGKGEVLVVGTGWEAYLAVLGQVAAAALFVGAGVVVAWAFGREHADRTFGALFALAVSRADMARAKVTVLVVWVLVVAAGVVAVALAVGFLGQVEPGRGPSLGMVARVGAVAVWTMLLALPIGLVASAGRGYVPAFGAVIGVVAVAQVLVFLGAGGWFPFAVPGLFAVAGTGLVAAPGPAQFGLVALTVVAGCWGTIRWWARAEVV